MENIKINITSNGTTTLATAGKYCERNVDIDVLVTGGGGGASLLDSEGSLFMTADEEAFCVDGNDRMVDVTEFPEKPLDNVVYRKNEKTTTSDGQLTYINETTSYGIPVQTDHSNGLHYKNVDVLQYVGGEESPHAWLRTDGQVVEALTYCSLIGIPKQGYKIVNTVHEWDKNDTDYVYLIRSRNMGMVYLFSWVAVSATRINNPSEASTIQDDTIYYGGGWQSLTALKECENVSADNGKTLYKLIVGDIKGEFNDPSITRVRDYAFAYCDNLQKIKMINAVNIGRHAFSYCNHLLSIDIDGGGTIVNNSFKFCERLRCLVFRADKHCFPGLKPSEFLSGCYHFFGEAGVGNEEGLQDGYIYVPLSQIESYKTGSNSSELASQYMPFVETMSELYALDTSKYTIAYLGSFGQECKYENGGWRDLR